MFRPLQDLLKPRPLSHIPGPRSLPIFGSSLALDQRHPHISMHEMSKQYGPVFRINIDGKPSVVVCDYDSIYEVLVSKSAQFAGRSTPYLSDVRTEGRSGIGRTDPGPELQGRRKLIHAFLKLYGSGMKRLEDVIVDATEDMIQNLMSQNGQPVDIKVILYRCVYDVTAIMMIGETFSDDVMMELQQLWQLCGKTSVGLSVTFASEEIVNRFPFMRYFGNTAYLNAMEAVAMKYTLIHKWFENKPQHGLVNFMLSLSEEEQREYQIPEAKHQMQVLFDFLTAGTFTTSATLTMLMNVLCQRADVQEKLRREFLKVIGDSRLPCLSDRENMPYHMATLLEISRYASVMPLSLPHKTVQDTTFESSGRTIPIPAGTEVLTHLWSMHHSEEFWQDPFSFDPGRFLDPAGQLVPADHPNRRHLMPFGAGHRVCVAEVFAMNRMFLILSRIVQTFHILPESTLDQQPSCDPRKMIYGSVLSCNPFKVRLELITRKA